MFGKTSKLTPALEELKQLDKYFHFGRVAMNADPYLFFNDLKQYLEKYDIRTIEGLGWNLQEDIRLSI